MTAPISSRLFDLSAYAIAGVSYYYNWSSAGASFLSSSLRGTQSFAIVSIFDKVIRTLFVRNVQGEMNSSRTTLLDPFIEEAIYSGVLLTQSNAWMIPRFAAALFIGETAARALTGRVIPEQNKQGFALETKISFLWAISRELLLLTLPHSSIPALLLDSCVFALVEVCPKENHLDLPKFSSVWTYKVLSSAFFRITANTVATTHGMVASIAQHLLFNISQTFQGGASGQINELRQ